MAPATRRLIIVPQFPVAMRYQEWWHWYLRNEYSRYFQEVIQLGPPTTPLRPEQSEFSVASRAIQHECLQVTEYMYLPLRDDDVLLLCDLSFPGIFAHALIHKPPPKCFTICHATAANRHDLFQPIRHIKYPIEEASARLFDGIFVGSKYHKKKLNWEEWSRVPVHVVGMPRPPIQSLLTHTRRPWPKTREFVSVARPSPQKVDGHLENEFQIRTGEAIERMPHETWDSYFSFLGSSRFLIVTSREETYGYQIADALLVGTMPIAPNRFSYPELLPGQCLYEPDNGVDSMIETVERLRASNLSVSPPVLGQNFFRDTARIMLS